MELKDLYAKKLDKKSLAECGACVIDRLKKGGRTFMELSEDLNFPAELIRASLNTLTKNGVLDDMLGRYVLEEGSGDFVAPKDSHTARRSKYRAVVPAKLNLSLAVVGKGDKLHELDMFFCPFDLVWDEAEFVPADDNELVVGNSTLQEDFSEELFAKWARPKVEKLLKKFGATGKVTVKKGVPLGAGLGGSTACLVAVYFAIKKYADEKGLKYDFTPKYFASLSSDFLAMSLGRACRVQGVGDKVTAVDENVKIKFVGFKMASGGSDTAAVYKKFDEKGRLVSARAPETVIDALRISRNDLFAPACALNKEIKKTYNELKAKSPKFVIMTGSGSAVVALDYFI